MIKQASITVAEDGGVLISLPRTGMRSDRPVKVAIANGVLRIGQGGKIFVAAEVNDVVAVAAIGHTDDITIAEADEYGLELFEQVEKVAV